MSESNIDDDALISQDDIDKLLNSSLLDDEESIIGGPEEDLGELSQDDIDSLLNNISLDVQPSGDQPAAPDEPSGDDLELVSQDDIDRLMNSALPMEDGPAVPDEPSGEETELVSQDDIDRLMNSALPMEDGPAVPDEPSGEETELVSQDDIDRLMNSALPMEDGSAVPDEPSGEEPELVSQDDIDRLMNSALPMEDGSAVPDEPSGEEPELVSQDDIDSLLNNISSDVELSREGSVKTDELSGEETEFVSRDDIDSLISDESSDVFSQVLEVSEGGVVDTEDETPIDESEAVGIDENLISQEVIDRLMAEEPEPDPEIDPEIDLEQLLGPDPVSQTEVPIEQEDTEEDIDAFLRDDIDDTLQDDELDDDFGENDLISQEDIDDFLNISEEEDEDILGDLDEDLDGDFDPGDDLDLDQEEQQVILEEEEALVTVPAGKWYRSKKVLACVVAVLVLAVALPVGYLKFFTTKDPDPLQMGLTADVAPSPETQVETVEIDLTGRNIGEGAGNIVLEDFLLLVSGKEAGLSYVTASVSIDYSDGRALTEINSNLPLYRDVIFHAMGKAIGSEKVDKLTEADLRGNIKEALNLVLPGRYVDRVTFIVFSTG